MTHDDPAKASRLAELADKLDCFTQDDVQLLTGTSLATVESWRKRGTGPSYALVGNHFLYPRSSLREWLQSQVRARRSAVHARECL